MSPNMPGDPFEGTHGPMPVDITGAGPAVGKDKHRMAAVECWCGVPGCKWIIALYYAAPAVMYD